MKTKTQKAMAELGRLGGLANVKKHGKRRMKQISRDYWKGRDTKEKVAILMLKQCDAGHAWDIGDFCNRCNGPDILAKKEVEPLQAHQPVLILIIT